MTDLSRKPVATVEELSALDNDEIVEGYMDGFDNEPAPGDNRSKSYWHGYRNGQVDGGHVAADAAQVALAKEIIESGYFRRLS